MVLRTVQEEPLVSTCSSSRCTKSKIRYWGSLQSSIHEWIFQGPQKSCKNISLSPSWKPRKQCLKEYLVSLSLSLPWWRNIWMMMLMYLFDMVQIHITRQPCPFLFLRDFSSSATDRTIMKPGLFKTKTIS